MIIFTVEAAIQYLDESLKLTRRKKDLCLRAEVFLTTRTTPNNIFIAICKKINIKKNKNYLLYWLSRGRERYKFLKFNNFFSVSKMFAETTAFAIKNKQIIFKLIGKGRNKTRTLSKELRMWKIPLFFFKSKVKRPFNGCKFPHTRRI